MNEIICVQFMCNPDELIRMHDSLLKLEIEGNFVPIERSASISPPLFKDGAFSVTGSIDATFATMLRLRDPFLADRMHVSYIDDNLKDKYRRK